MPRPADIVCDALVVGGGAAGIAAAVELSASGLRVALVEQRPALGGAYYRQPASGSEITSRRTREWRRLQGALARTSMTPLMRHIFLGIDTDGLVLLDDRAAGRVLTVSARAIVVAVGAIERILPRPGWEVDGVMTAGGLQMLVKETGEAPRGDILIAGNGPLSIALAADLARIGRHALAVVEAGDPFAHPVAALRLSAFPDIALEAMTHLARMRSAGTSWLRGSRLISISPSGGRLIALVEDRHGSRREIAADTVALHDGIKPNDFGLPADIEGGPVVIRAGDCREALGIRSAEADGRAAARRAIAVLSGGHVRGPDPKISRQRRAQAVLAELFQPLCGEHGLFDLPDNTVLCRCEGRTAGDLRVLLAAPDPIGLREIKLTGRFGMGPCQGRFCAENVRALVARARPGEPVAALARDRWPARPVQIAALAAREDSRGE